MGDQGTHSTAHRHRHHAPANSAIWSGAACGTVKVMLAAIPATHPPSSVVPPKPGCTPVWGMCKGCAVERVLGAPPPPPRQIPHPNSPLNQHAAALLPICQPSRMLEPRSRLSPASAARHSALQIFDVGSTAERLPAAARARREQHPQRSRADDDADALGRHELLGEDVRLSSHYHTSAAGISAGGEYCQAREQGGGSPLGRPTHQWS